MNAADFDTASLHKEFIAESRDLLDRSEEVALRLEHESGTDILNELFRLIHTVKGNLGIFRNRRLTSVTHSLETLLNQVRTGKVNVHQNLIDLILESVDWIRTALANPEATLTHGMDMEAKIDAAGIVAEAVRPEVSHNVNHKQVQKAAPEKIKIAARLLREVQSKGQKLALAYVDIARQADATLNGFQSNCRAAIEAGELLTCRLRFSEIPELAEQNGGALPALLLFASEDPGRAGLERYGIKAERIRIVSTPPAAVKPEARTIVPDKPAPTVAREIPAEVENAEAIEPAAAVDHLRVPLPLIDRLINLAGSTVGARNELMQQILKHDDPRLHLVGSRLGQMVTRMQEEIMRTRLQEVRSLFRRIPRTVRDVARLTGKTVNVSFDGEEVELDKNLMDVIGEAILHMVRNAIDHGIELPAERIRLGKPEIGQIRISAAVRNGNVALTIRDDGKGLDLEALKRSAIARDLITASDAAGLSDDECAELIFLPGLSTAETVTETSGRGVGMDAVRESFKRIGGTISISSRPGKGTEFEALLPQTLSIITCFTVKVRGSSFAIPQTDIDELVRLDAAQVSQLGGCLVYTLRERLLALLDLGELLQGPSTETKQERFLVVVQSERNRYGLIVDEIGNPEEILVKPLGTHFAGLELYAGAAVLGDGSITAILDSAGLARFARLQFVGEQDAEARDSDLLATADLDSYVLFDSDGQRFAVSTDYSPRIERVKPGSIERVMGRDVVKHTGKIIPVIHPGISFGTKDKSTVAPSFLVLLSADGTTIALAAHAIHTIEKSLGEIQHDGFDEDFVSGRAIINDRTVLAINVPAFVNRLRQEGFHDRDLTSAALQIGEISGGLTI
ncbi:MAG: chemotaxis protein CheW [Spirochaetia bacterium]|nr:chemotaxis protein CheW [Spirochaetia bacterium]